MTQHNGHYCRSRLFKVIDFRINQKRFPVCKLLLINAPSPYIASQTEEMLITTDKDFSCDVLSNNNSLLERVYSFTLLGSMTITSNGVHMLILFVQKRPVLRKRPTCSEDSEALFFVDR